MTETDDSDLAALPEYSEETLAALDPRELISLMVRDEDRVPRNVIDACARHGEKMIAELRLVLEEGSPWKDSDTAGEWWLTLHAAMILGLIPGEQAGLLLVAYMRRISLEKDGDMQDWLAGLWPALFRNKSDGVLSALRALCTDPDLDWYIRANALGPVIAAGEREGSTPLDEALAWAAAIATDEAEEWDMRLSAGNTLLDFAPTAHRALLENLAERQIGLGAWFSKADLEKAYSAGEPKPEWHRRTDPWEFYTLGAIAKRQDRWAMEAAENDEEDEYDFDYPSVLTHVRDAPKVGRNDPCPCGSGKKYKKCCLVKSPP